MKVTIALQMKGFVPRHSSVLRHFCASGNLEPLCGSLWQRIPSRTASAVTRQEALGDQRGEGRFQRVGTCAMFAHHVARRDAAMFASVIENIHGQFWQGGKRSLLPLHLSCQAALLLLEGAREEYEPGLPIRRVATDGPLRLTQGQIVALLAVLDDALKRGIRDIGITRLE
jgi:hypothetical protein